MSAPADFAAMDARVDLTDHYAFQKPGDPSRTVLIVNVNPLAPRHANEFRQGAVYETLIDTDQDAAPNIAFRFRFSQKEQGRQFARASRVDLHRALEDGHLEGETQENVLVENAPVSFDTAPRVTRGQYDTCFFAGLRSDPFFFDLTGFWNDLNFTGSDFFIDKNVFSIALEIPKELLGSNPHVGIWTRTLVPMLLQPDHLTQVDQIGRPAVLNLLDVGQHFATVFPSAQLAAKTSGGGSLIELVDSELQRLGGYSATQARVKAETLVPDILQFDHSSAEGFPNGRRLQDNVIDVMLKLVTNRKITSDGVGPHTDYLAEFPYVGPPHTTSG